MPANLFSSCAHHWMWVGHRSMSLIIFHHFRFDRHSFTAVTSCHHLLFFCDGLTAAERWINATDSRLWPAGDTQIKSVDAHFLGHLASGEFSSYLLLFYEGQVEEMCWCEPRVSGVCVRYCLSATDYRDYIQGEAAFYVLPTAQRSFRMLPTKNSWLDRYEKMCEKAIYVFPSFWPSNVFLLSH